MFFNNIYNPKDCRHRPYFTITDLWVYRNASCALTEKDYEQMCDKKWINPIYPSDFLTPSNPEKREKKEKPRKKIIPRPPRQPREYPKVDNVYDRIKKRREELNIKL